jgi:class 3 adenylate cyclase/tetratricopeptide (TPR) repeat protein
VGDIEQWLRRHGLDQYTSIFAENDIDEDVLSELTDQDLRELGISLGHRRRLLKAIASRTASPAASPGGGSGSPDLATPRADIEAERRHLTVMFCDLVGSTKLATRIDPEDLRAVVRRFHETCAETVRSFDGFVAKYMGDGILVYFGYPRAHENDAERAVRTGLAVVEAVKRLAMPTGEALAVRIGISTGLVVVGDLIGEGAAQEETVIGETPNLAARLQEVATPDTVVIAGSTRRLLGGLFDCEDLGHRVLKGIPEPVAVWRAVEPSGAATRFEAVHRGTLPPLIGRDEELGILLRRWRQAKDGEGQVVLVSGEAGIGKSRICQALRQRIAGEPHVRVRYQCSPFFTKIALHPVIEQLSRAAGFARDDSASERLGKMEDMLRLAMDDIADIVPVFATLLSTDIADRYRQLQLSPEQLREKTFSALLRQMKALAACQPMLVIFEDVHWIDPTSLELLDRVVDSVQTLPILIIVTYRRDFAPPWVDQPHVTLIALSRMHRRDCGAIVKNITCGKALPDGVLEEIVRKTDGVPLFLEELTKTIIESGLLEEQADRYVLNRPLPALAIPTSLHDSLMARLDRLAPAKEVAQTGAAIGREFPHELIAAVSPLSKEELADALDQLVSSELIFRRGVSPNSHYMFKHSLVRDVAYESLLKSRRRKLHQSIAEVLEVHFPDASKNEPELLAHHTVQGELWEKASGYLRESGARAAARSAYREAVACFEQAVGAYRNLPETPETVRQTIEVLFELRSTLQPLGEHERVLKYLRLAERNASALGDQHSLGWASAYLSQYLWWTGDRHQADRLGRRALAIAADLDSFPLQVVANFFLGQGCFNVGDFPRAIDYLRRNVAVLEGERALERFRLTGLPSVLSRVWLGWSLAERGAFSEAMPHAEEARTIAEAADQPYSKAWACLGVGQIQLIRGAIDEAISTLELTADLCRTWDLHMLMPMTAAVRGLAYALQGQIRRALPILEESESHNGDIRIYHSSTAAIALATGYLLAGRLDAAAETATEIADRATACGHRASEARALELLGGIHDHREPRDEVRSEDYYRRALALAEEMGMVPLVAHCHHGLGRLYRRCGAQRTAEEHRDKADRMYRDLGMRFWLEQARTSDD